MNRVEVRNEQRRRILPGEIQQSAAAMVFLLLEDQVVLFDSHSENRGKLERIPMAGSSKIWRKLQGLEAISGLKEPKKDSSLKYTALREMEEERQIVGKKIYHVPHPSSFIVEQLRPTLEEGFLQRHQVEITLFAAFINDSSLEELRARHALTLVSLPYFSTQDRSEGRRIRPAVQAALQHYQTTLELLAYAL